MEPVFQNKIWRGAAISSYFGMLTAITLITFVLPITFVCMGETNFGNLAVHSESTRTISYWLIGLGGITFGLSTLCVIATMVNSKVFQIVMTCLAGINVLLAVSLLIWGLVPNDARRDYLQDVWNEMDISTRELIQKHYSCCGFERFERTSPKNCFAGENETAVWPKGCYDRVTTYRPPSQEVTFPDGKVRLMGDGVVNVMLLGFVIPFVFVIFFQSMTTILFAVALMQPSPLTPSGDTSKIKREVYENKYATGHANGTQDSNSNGVGNGRENGVQINTVYKTTEMEEGKHNTASVASEEEKVWYQKIPDAISSTLENCFFWIGCKVGTYPKMTIVLSLVISVFFSLGLIQRQDQPIGSSGFLSKDAEILKQVLQYTLSFKDGRIRNNYIIVVDENNVLVEEKFKSMHTLDMNIKNVNDSNGLYYSDICVKVSGSCNERSLFELWNYNESVISQLTMEEVLTKINSNPVSPIFNDAVDITKILGSISRDNNSKIIGANAHLFHYIQAIKDEQWERGFVDAALAGYEGLTVHVKASGSRRFETASYQRELPLLFGGFGLIFIYIILMTGKFSLIEHRAYIALMGVFTAGLSMAAGIGLSASLGFQWSVIHLVAPFLIIGIGVDDMFILIQAWNTVEDDPELSKKSLPERAGHAIKSSGVSITVTSVTDLVAFAVGATSDLGSFASFSVYVAVCIIILFLLQCTLFLACTVLDQRRREARYDACLACCYQHDESYKPGKCSEREFFSKFFEDVLGKIVQMLPVQIVAILLTLGVTAVMGWGFSQLKVSFDADWYLPEGSYVTAFNNEFDKYFSGGYDAKVAVIGSDFYAEREKLHILYEKLRENDALNPKYLKSWFENYADWAQTTYNISDLYADDAFVNESQFYQSVMLFLQGKGKSYSNDVTFNRSQVIIAARFHIRHKLVPDGVDNVDIMESIRANCDSVGFSGTAFPYARLYFNLEIMKIIRNEVYRNLGLTLLCVFIMVIPMIASIQMSFWVVLCVVFTIVDVAGSMYFAGLTIETSTIITLLLSVGLAVDYAAHVAHKFLTLKGTRKMRVRVTMGQIGPAVFNGGFSTFLALVLLAGSDTYSYKVFFTVFVCVVAYGLWNGLVFLPSVLAILGPEPHSTAVEAKLSQRHFRLKTRVQSETSLDQVQSNNSVERT